MLRTGLCSITHRKLSVDQVIDLAVACGLSGIEWGGDVHVPHGDIMLAESVLDRTLAAGLLCPSYGSYYKVGVSEAAGLRFEDVLDTADALGVPLVRLWAGNRNREDVTRAEVKAMAAETRRLADLALERGMGLAFEYHRGSLTNTPAGCRELLEAVDRATVQTYWQPVAGVLPADNLAALTSLLPWLRHLHVFHWRAATRPDGTRRVERRPLAEGAEAWRTYLDALAGSEAEHWLYLEFSMNDDPAATTADAAVLNRWTEGR